MLCCLTIDDIVTAAASDTVQSLTKFYDGQNVAVGGAIVSSTKEMDEKMRLFATINGNIMAPQTAFYILQAIKVYIIAVFKMSSTTNIVRHMRVAHTHTALYCW